ncbi:MAG: helix-turn-helix domain-containing protein, partial [Proteobacteria bacterium]|nr:helix-turn-helix domain-containing protein [Pseudomonadota bacterium]
LFVTGGNVLAVLMISVFLGYNRYPDFLQLLKTQIEKQRYEKSYLTGVDIQGVNERLMELVEGENIYRESELNLKTLADRLSITSHQLSQFLNERVGLDFRSFLNTFRVREAKRLLAEDPDKNILEICYEVGFGSKSTFNSVFKKETGQTPREFRDAAALMKD